MYDPTRFETRRSNEPVVRSCPNCFKEFVVKRSSADLLCSDACAKEYDELGPFEPRCIDFDAEDNM